MQYAILLLPLLWVVIWYGVLRLIAWAGGWTRLAAHYPGTRSPNGVKLRDTWITVGWADYNGCVNYVVEEEGLHISLWPLFNIGHAPLFIPWADMRVEDVFKQFLRRGLVVKISIGDPLVCRLRLPKRVFDAGKQLVPAAANADAPNEA